MSQKRTLAFKLRVLQLHLCYNNTAKQAFFTACKEHGTTPSGCMTDHSTSYMWDYKVEIKKKAETDETVKNFLSSNKIEL